MAAISSIYSESNDTNYLSYFAQHIKTVDGFPALEFYSHLENVLILASSNTQDKWMTSISDVASDPGISPYAKIGVVRTMSSFLSRFDKDKSVTGKERADSVRTKIQKIIKDEDNEQLKSIYSSFMGS